jgi:hypothetical protein
MAGIAAAFIVLASIGLPRAADQASAEEDASAVVDAFGAAINAEDGAAAAALFADDGQFMDINGGSLGVFGREALDYWFSQVGGTDATATEVSREVVSETEVHGVIEFTDTFVLDAGVDRIIQFYEAVVVEKRITSFIITYDERDEQTATYLEYISAPGSELPAEDQLEATMTGEVEGLGYVLLFDGFAWTYFDGLEGGPADVWQPMALHEGTCADLGDVVTPLAPLVNGQESSLTSEDFAAIEDGDFAFVVHASEEDDTIVSCGEIARVEPPTPEPTATEEPVSLPDTGTGASNDSGLVSLIAALAAAGALGTLTAFGMRRRA